MGIRSTGTSETGRRRNRRPGVLGPWLATGLGLVALNTTPAVQVTEPAYAATPSFHATIAAPNLGSSLTSLSAQSRMLAIPAPSVPVASAAAGLSVVMLTPIPSRADGGLSASADRVAEHAAMTELPLPRTTDATTTGADTERSMNEQWADLRHCEATSDYRAINNSGKYRGAYQFDQATWESVGGVGDPAAASALEQDKRARILFERRGSSPWPECGRFLN